MMSFVRNGVRWNLCHGPRIRFSHFTSSRRRARVFLRRDIGLVDRRGIPGIFPTRDGGGLIPVACTLSWLLR